MPELPEVETVRRGLAQHLTGVTIENVTLHRANLRIPFPPHFAQRLANSRITTIERRAKYLLFRLEHGMVLLAHLGMSGCFSIRPHAALPNKHEHAVFSLSNGQQLIYTDPRRFGLMTLVEKEALAIHPLLASLGPEPFSSSFHTAYLNLQLLRRNIAIKPALMDQKLVVGVGNIYASEALFLAKIHPQTPSKNASKHAKSIISAIKTVLTSAIESGGSSLRDFVNIAGEGGYFQHHFQVYGRAGKPCYHCTTPISSIIQAGRSSFFCPKCQK